VRGAARCCKGRGRYTPPIKPHFSPLSYKMTCTNCCRKTTSPLTHSLTHSYCPHSDDASKARTSQTQSRAFTHHSLTPSLHHSLTHSCTAPSLAARTRVARGASPTHSLTRSLPPPCPHCRTHSIRHSTRPSDARPPLPR
jgi:hypothetical protein